MRSRRTEGPRDNEMNDHDDPEPEPEELLKLFPPESDTGPGVRKTCGQSWKRPETRASSHFEPLAVPNDLVIAHGPLGLLLRELPVMGGRYRLDFAIVDAVTSKYVAIECDGHEFHEKTKEQAKHDRARDRALIADGWTVLRFTGSEVWSDAPACVREVVRMLLPGKKRRVG